MPRYHFVVHAPDHHHDDPDGSVLPDPQAAKEHGHRLIRELKEGDYHPPGATLQVVDETGQLIHSIPF
jgi:hypothetical protein